jgi:SHS family lactate transporter-like MFS transporter
LLASINLPLQAWIAGQNGGDYAKGLAFVVAPVFVAVAVLAAIGPENRGVEFGEVTPAELDQAHGRAQPARAA